MNSPLPPASCLVSPPDFLPTLAQPPRPVSKMSKEPPTKKRKANDPFKGVGAMLIRPQLAARTGATARMTTNPPPAGGRRRGVELTKQLLPAPVAVHQARPLAQVPPLSADFEGADPLEDLGPTTADVDNGQMGDDGVTVICRARRSEDAQESAGSTHLVSDIPAPTTPSAELLAQEDALAAFLAVRDEFGEELMMEEGRGEFTATECPGCSPAADGSSAAAFRCAHCDTKRLLCRRCVLSEHKHQVLHLVQVRPSSFVCSFGERASNCLPISLRNGSPRAGALPGGASATLACLRSLATL